MESLRSLEPGQLTQLFPMAYTYNLGDLSILKRIPPSKRFLFTAMLAYLRSHISLQWSDLNQALLDEGWTPAHREALLSEFERIRNRVERLKQTDRVTDFRWRVDVSLSTNSLAKVLKPEVLVKFRTCEFECQFHLSVRQFIELRRSTAALLRDLQALDHYVFIKSIR